MESDFEAVFSMPRSKMCRTDVRCGQVFPNYGRSKYPLNAAPVPSATNRIGLSVIELSPNTAVGLRGCGILDQADRDNSSVHRKNRTLTYAKAIEPAVTESIRSLKADFQVTIED